MVGSGVLDYGNVGVMAVRPSDGDRIDLNTVKHYGYRSRFTHLTETVEPGREHGLTTSWNGRDIDSLLNLFSHVYLEDI